MGSRWRAYSVLSVVCGEPGGITQRQVGDDVVLDPSQVVALVDELESRGLVAWTADPNDRRNKLVVATKRGRGLRKQAQERTANSPPGMRRASSPRLWSGCARC